MLSIRVGHILYSIAGEQVTHIDYAGTVTALPFTEAPIEGLVHFNARPLLQINVAAALGLEPKAQAGGKRLIVNSAHGCFALRVDEVVALDKSPPSADDRQAPVILPLKKILPPALTAKKLPQHTIPAKAVQQKLAVLLVAAGEKTIALLARNIDRIQEMSALQSLTGGIDSQGGLLLRVKDRLLPSRSLGRLLQLEEAGQEPLAVIVRGAQGTWALSVQRVIGLETIEQVYSSGADARGLWYVTPTGQIRELIDANTLAPPSPCSPPRLWYAARNGDIQELIDADTLTAANNAMPPITITAPQQTTHAGQRSEQLITEGLCIYCGSGGYLLPMTMASRILENLDLSTMTASRFTSADRSNRARRIPWIDAAALLFGVRSEAIKNTVVINLADGGAILLGVDRVLLSQAVSAGEKWSDVDLPYPVTLFFDAACYDERAGQWLLRTVSTITFAGLPWTAKKSLAKAILGWFDRQ